MVIFVSSVWKSILGITICAAVSITVHRPVHAQGSNTYCVSGLSSQGQYNFLVIRFSPNLQSGWRQDINLRNGDCVQVIGEYGDFYRVRYRDRYEGWSAKLYLTRDVPRRQEPPSRELSTVDRIDALEKLGLLRKSGVLSDEEFEREKLRILGD